MTVEVGFTPGLVVGFVTAAVFAVPIYDGDVLVGFEPTADTFVASLGGVFSPIVFIYYASVVLPHTSVFVVFSGSLTLFPTPPPSYSALDGVGFDPVIPNCSARLGAAPAGFIPSYSALEGAADVVDGFVFSFSILKNCALLIC